MGVATVRVASLRSAHGHPHQSPRDHRLPQALSGWPAGATERARSARLMLATALSVAVTVGIVVSPHRETISFLANVGVGEFLLGRGARSSPSPASASCPC